MFYYALVTILSLFMYLALLTNTARARGKYKIMAPAVTGHIEFEKRLRVQLNTLEHMIIFLPALWLCGFFWPFAHNAIATLGINSLNAVFSSNLGALIGAVWIVARIAYAIAYYRNPEKRYPAIIISLFCLILMLLGSFSGILILMYQHYTTA